MDPKRQGMIVGQKGVQYGLQLRRGPGGAAAGSAQPRKKPATTGNVFGADSDSEDDVGAQVARQADKKRAAAKVQQMYEDALAQDASVFDYDGVYDSMQEQKVQPKQQEKIERKSRYIAQLKEQAERRKREDDIAFERRQLKERAKEDHLFEDKEVFVTAAYKKKLEEQRLWQEEERRKEEEEAKRDVRNIGHMGNFYANLLTKNVAMGAEQADAADTREGAGGDGDGGDAAEAGPGPRDSERVFTREELEKTAAKAGVTLDKYEVMRIEAEHARRQRAKRSQQAGGAEPESPPSQAPGGTGAQAQPDGADCARDGVPLSEAVGVAPGRDAAAGEAAAAGVAPSAPAAGKRRNDDSAVQSARERYLARKKQQTGT